MPHGEGTKPWSASLQLSLHVFGLSSRSPMSSKGMKSGVHDAIVILRCWLNHREKHQVEPGINRMGYVNMRYVTLCYIINTYGSTMFYTLTPRNNTMFYNLVWTLQTGHLPFFGALSSHFWWLTHLFSTPQFFHILMAHPGHVLNCNWGLPLPSIK